MSFASFMAAAESPDYEPNELPELTADELAEYARAEEQTKRATAAWEAAGHKCERGHEISLDSWLQVGECPTCYYEAATKEWAEEVAALNARAEPFADPEDEDAKLCPNCGAQLAYSGGATGHALVNGVPVEMDAPGAWACPECDYTYYER